MAESTKLDDRAHLHTQRGGRHQEKQRNPVVDRDQIPDCLAVEVFVALEKVTVKVKVRRHHVVEASTWPSEKEAQQEEQKKQERDDLEA